MQSLTEICALLSKNIITSVVSALFGTDLSGSLEAGLLLLTLGSCSASPAELQGQVVLTTITQSFAKTFMACIAMRWYKCLKPFKQNGLGMSAQEFVVSLCTSWTCQH